MTVRTAVILAAGMGTRLGSIGREIPKGFLRCGDRPILEESIDHLTHDGVERIVIVTGHLREFYDELANRSDAHTDMGVVSLRRRVVLPQPVWRHDGGRRYRQSLRRLPVNRSSIRNKLTKSRYRVSAPTIVYEPIWPADVDSAMPLSRCAS